jgi:hypothetical protein
MFTVYSDDSGTDPNQRVAMATALIIPDRQIMHMEQEWDKFRSKYGFTIFHTSEFVHRNSKSEFANWNIDKQRQVFARVRQISMKYGVRAFSVAVNKRDYDEVVPQDFRKVLGKDHYSWAMRQLIAFIDKWFVSKIQRKWLFQWMEPRDQKRNEVEIIMEQMQWISERSGIAGDYKNHTFRKSDNTPGLQCVDAISWVCYRYADFLFSKKPLHEFAAVSWHDFQGDLGEEGWLVATTIVREKLEKSIKKALEEGKATKFWEEWEEHTSHNEIKIPVRRF